ncbi:hypothetical protein ABIC83_002890 [Roseateles asaccharophilus]
MQAIHLRPLAMALGLSLEAVTPHAEGSESTDDPSELIGLHLIQKVATAIRDGRLGARQARIMLDILEELAPTAADA